MLYRLRNLLHPLRRVCAKPFLALGISPNAITLAGIALAAIAGLTSYWKLQALALALALLSCFSDFLDGAVAREGRQQTQSGDLLDAVADRIVELCLLAAWASQFPLLTSLCIGLSFLVSYIKARTGLVIAIDNADWPSLAGRADRLVLILLGYAYPQSVGSVLSALALLCSIGCLQRFLFAHQLIAKRKEDPASA